jgi:hypothetical protein
MRCSSIQGNQSPPTPVLTPLRSQFR